MKKKIKLILLSIFAFSIVVFNVYAANDNLTNAFYTATRTNATKISTSTNSLVHHNETIPSEYTLALGETYETASSGGCTNRLSAAEKAVYTNSSSTANQTIVNEDACKAKASIKGNYYMKYSKIGTYNGKNIDVKLTIMDFHLNEEYLSTRGVGVVGFYNGTSYATDPNSGRLGVTSIGGDWVKVKYEFFENGTNTPISVKGFTNYWDVDSWQGIHFIDGITGLYASDKTALYFNEINGKPFVSAPNNYLNTEHYTPVGHIAETFEASTMTRVYSFSRPDASLDSSTPIKFANGGIWHSAVVSNAKKSYAENSPAGKDNTAVKVGDEIDYKIQFTNGDAVNQATVTITDTLSKGLTYKANSAKIGNTALALKEGYPSVDSTTGVTTLVWETTLDPEASATLTYGVTVNEQAQSMVNNAAVVRIGTEEYTLSELKNPVPVKEYAQNTQAGSNQSAVKKDDVITYSIKYGNVSSESAKVVITDTLSAGLTYQPGSAKVGGTTIADPTISGNTLTFTRESVAANASEELTYGVKVDGTTETVKNAASIKYNNAPSIALNELTNPVPSKTYGGTSLSDNAGWNHAVVKDGDNIKYQIVLPVVKNSTDTIIVTDVLSKGLTYNEDIQVQNGTIDSVEEVIDDSNKTTTLVMVIKKSAQATRIVLTYSAKVNSNAVNMVNNNANCQYNDETAIQLNKLNNPINVKEYSSDTPAGMNGKAVQKGDSIKYNINYVNAYETAKNITITDSLSNGLEYTEKTAKVCTQGENEKTCVDLTNETVTKNSDGTTTIVWSRDQVPAGAVETIEYTVKVTGNTVKVQNSATISYDGEPPIDTNELNNPVPVKSYDKNTKAGKNSTAVKIGDRITYNIRYVNVYDKKVTITIKDTLSKGLTYVKGSSKVGSQKIADPVISTDGKTLTWTREVEKDQEEELTYEVTATGEVALVNNKASLIYSNNPSYEAFLNKLYNPVPTKTYASNTKAGKNGATVKKDDVITYSIKYGNAKDTKTTVIIKDNLSKGLTYVNGSAKIAGKSVAPKSVTKTANGTMIVWMTDIEKGQTAELTYSAKVVGNTKTVNNNANIQYGDDPVINLAQLQNPLYIKPDNKVVPIPDTGSNIKVIGILAGILLSTGGGYLIYRRYQKA